MKRTVACRRPWTCLILIAWVLGLIADLTGCGASQMGQNQAAPATKQLTAVAISPQTPSIVLGNSVQLSATALFSDGSRIDVTGAATWVSAQPNVASINAAGMVMSKTIGSASISALYKSVSGSSTLTVAPPDLVSIAVTPQSPSLTPNHSVQLSASGTFTDGTTQDLSSMVTWSSTATGVLTINATGLSTAKSPGAATITASEGSISGSATVTVVSPTLVSITVAPANPALKINQTVQLSASGTFSDGSTQDLSSAVSWSSTPPGIVITSSTGLATAKVAGAATVIASEGSITGSDTVTVAPPTLISITVGPANPALKINQTVQLSASGTFSDGSTQDLSSAVAWSSTPPGIIIIGSTGLATAKAPGAATIVATDASINGGDTITVAPPTLMSIALSPQNLTLTPEHSVQLTAVGSYSDGSTQDISASAAWSASPGGVVAVTNSGLAIGQAPGIATISASLNAVAASDIVNVVAPTLTSISITPNGESIPTGQNQQLAATGLYSDGSMRDLTSSAQWLSSNPTVLSVSNLGMATANALGSATVTARWSGMSGVAQMQVSGIVSLTLVPASPVLVLRGSEPLTALATFADGSTQDITASVSWSSSDPGIASVSNGVLFAWRVGSATISASFGPVVGYASVTVKPVLAVSYFSNANMSGFADGAVRINNPGLTGANLCAEIYVFDQDQQLSECCGCLVSPNGLRTLSVNTDLTGNPLTGVKSRNGVVKIVPAYVPSNSLCDPTAISPKGSLVAWSTHTQQQSASSFSVTETTFQLGPLGDDDLAALQSQCSFASTLGSGQGICSCGTGVP
jgi:hypothetical protein